MLLFRVWVLFGGEGRDRTSATATYLLRPAQEWDKMKTKDWYTDAQPFNLRHANPTWSGNSAVQLRARYASVKLSGGLQCDHQAWLDVVISHVTLMCAATMKPRTLTVNIQYDAL